MKEEIYDTYYYEKLRYTGETLEETKARVLAKRAKRLRKKLRAV